MAEIVNDAGSVTSRRRTYADTGTACIWSTRYITAREKRNICGSVA